jgi:dTDP-4-dehydrorhamnose reductase
MTARPSSLVLVFGRNGQVARELHALRESFERPFLFLGRKEFNLEAVGEIEALTAHYRAGAVINAAAYTAVDKAESEPGAAFQLNRDAPAAMARACASLGLPFVHISTDYVFDGKKSSAYVETDPRAPQSVYGASKAEGEEAVTSAGGQTAILRTAWVFSSYGSNFLKTMVRLAHTREEIGVVTDQHGRPTWAHDVARACLTSLNLMERDRHSLGILHAAGSQDASWADFADMIFTEQANRGRPAPRVRRIMTADFPTPARRPKNSRLDTARTEAVLGWKASPLLGAIATVLDHLEQNP